jgi:hypothetical protein
MMEGDIVVTAQRLQRKAMDSAAAITAIQEDLGDLKLYRVPERVTVAAKGLKQIAFLDKDAVRGKMIYQADCSWWESYDEPRAAEMRFETVNDEKHGLGAALPTGAITFFEPSSHGDLFVGEQQLRDYAQGQDVEVPLGDSAQVFGTCAQGSGDPGKGWAPLCRWAGSPSSNRPPEVTCSSASSNCATMPRGRTSRSRWAKARKSSRPASSPARAIRAKAGER